MSVIIGIDVGGSTTKIVGYTAGGNFISTMQVTAADPVTSAYGALGKYLKENKIALSDIKQILLTGVGASFFEDNIYGVPTKSVDEFVAVGLGGLALSGKDEALIVSMGTGTAFVRASKNNIVHIGGSGVGGGTLMGLCGKLVGASRFETIIEKAAGGSLSTVDLAISDISKGVITTLPPSTTASNFGKMQDTASDADVTLGVMNMVFQTIGMLAVFACRNDSVSDVVLTGMLSKLPQAGEIFSSLEKLHNINFIIPENSIFATAVGAALSYIQGY